MPLDQTAWSLDDIDHACLGYGNIRGGWTSAHNSLEGSPDAKEACIAAAQLAPWVRMDAVATGGAVMKRSPRILAPAVTPRPA